MKVGVMRMTENEKIIEALEMLAKQQKPHRPSRPKKDKLSFSKKFIMAVGAMGFVMFAYTIYFVEKTGDSMPLVTLISSVFIVFGAAAAFFIEKAKKENIEKIQKGDWEHED